jgi:amidase
MTQRIPRERATVTEFGPGRDPALHVAQGETFVVETHDAFAGAIAREADLPTYEAIELLRHEVPKGNPVGGPVHVEGVVPGDVLVVEIDDIVPADHGWTGFMSDAVNLALYRHLPELQEPFARITRHRPGPSGTTSDGSGELTIERTITYPLRPFVGTIVTAPERDVLNTVVNQGPWGGNLDCKHVARGNKVMLNVYHEGGLLSVGDVHAAQGDSEFCDFADESAAEVTLRCSSLSQRRIPGVLRIETPTGLVQVDSARNAGSMERALHGAFTGMLAWLTEDFGLSPREAALHFSVNPGVIVHTYQFVGPAFYVVGVEFPKESL